MSAKKCEKIQSELVAYLDDELEETQRKLVESHLSECDSCSMALAQLKQTMMQVSALPATAPSDEFLLRFEKRLEKEKTTPLRALVAWLARPRVLVGTAVATTFLLLIFLVLAIRPGSTAVTNTSEMAVAGHLDLFSDYEAIKNLDILEDMEFIEALDEDA